MLLPHMVENLTPRQISFRERLAANLKFFRGERGLSQEILADRAGVHRTHIGQLELGRRSVTLDTLVSLAKALGVDEFELLTERDDVVAVPVKMGRKRKTKPAGEEG
ncbi:DNA-binding transcriptional regulator, XRE-family HTH domain [Paraburkholderia tropica]|uniref:helix-turn-helix domain-containing protein n=1 Tax=Paraburkholderia tropica TaxID=92647 RepID=UPI001CB5A087|nr:helix-turn-helix transcriptional regulator [Paraburkholderia tropica]CAG9217749.1 DNA-binding transcriptional regulator, XRE-family HTH domain [Paraburkholderia tropica]